MQGRWIYVLRNPFDNIAAIYLRRILFSDEDGVRYKRFRKNFQAKVVIKGEHRRLFASIIREYFERIGAAHRLMQSEEKTCLIYTENFIKDPKKELKAMCEFLGVDPQEDYLEGCAKCISTKESRTREYIEWDKKFVGLIHEEMCKYPFMERYLSSSEDLL